MLNHSSQSRPQPTQHQNDQTNTVDSQVGSKSIAEWTTSDSASLYNIKGWGEPYFRINQKGNVAFSLPTNLDNSLDLAELVESLQQQQINPPLLIRLPDVMADRMTRLQNCMAQAIAHYGYSGSYQGVFPIKCNQNRHLVESLIDQGKSCQFGLEAGSKPELMIALASLDTAKSERQPLLMCNGYKDRAYIETALLATKLGQKPIIVIEQLRELDLTLAIAQELKIEPILGIRAKLETKGVGRWAGSTGDRAKFGLTITEILMVVQRLQTINRLSWLQLIHFHVGSQISAIRVIKNAIREASQIYVQLVKLGANMQYLNVGGGLAVDYDGSKTNFAASKNYNMQNYANDIVAQVKDACDQGNVSNPTLVSESGRAIAAHQSILIFDVLGTSNDFSAQVEAIEADAPLIIRNFWTTYQAIDQNNIQESYNDVLQFKQEALSLFNFGYLSLADRGKAEELYRACFAKIAAIIKKQKNTADDLQDLEKIMASIYYVNLSIFQSVPDAWAIEQLFPIMPIHRLNQKPTAKGILADITCDSDGKIDQFIDRKHPKSVLELHQLNNSQLSITPYYLGMFLVGAYQETMGNLHNLFGKINVAQIKLTGDGYQIDSIVPGDSVRDVLSHMHYDSMTLLSAINSLTETALKEKSITTQEAQKLWKNYTSSLDSYTYLKSDLESNYP